MFDRLYIGQVYNANQDSFADSYTRILVDPMIINLVNVLMHRCSIETSIYIRYIRLVYVCVSRVNYFC